MVVAGTGAVSRPSLLSKCVSGGIYAVSEWCNSDEGLNCAEVRVYKHQCVQVRKVKGIQTEVPRHGLLDYCASAIVFYRVFRGNAALQKARVVYAVLLLPPAGGVPLVPQCCKHS